jgi:hypothetical protein
MYIGAAEDIGHIKVLIDELKQRLETRKFKTELDLRETLDNIIINYLENMMSKGQKDSVFQRLFFYLNHLQ